VATPSLYRRYRPRRFSELKGQDHVVRALRNAVANHREGQAYLFSGPRGTGKTSSARILAKVLNCEAPVDGEPCCECSSCAAVEAGTSYDVFELDAASNRGIDDIRTLIERASLGTPGRHKVYILDEVHMLTKEANAALLKTLEEPPDHVVFVLATTDPQKVPETIRSRTQHLQFHLLGADTLHDHLRWVAADAGIDLDDSALATVVARGAGSARDALSALEVVAAAGGVVEHDPHLEDLLDALADHDTGLALATVAHAVQQGRDPRTVTEEVVRTLREAFLTLMAPELVQVPSDRLDALTEQARRVGAAGLVRAMEVLGQALLEMRHAPDPRLLVEVALVKLTHAEVDPGISSLLARVKHLEDQLAHGITLAAAPEPKPPVDPVTGRAKLGSRAGDSTGATPRPAPPAPPAVAPAPVAPAPVAPAPASGGEAGAVDLDRLTRAWSADVLTQLKPLVRALYAAGTVVGERDGALVIALPNEPHRDRAEQHRSDVETAVAKVAGRAIRLSLVVDGAARSGRDTTGPQPRPDAAASRPASPPEPDPVDEVADHLGDVDDVRSLPDVPRGSVDTPIERLTQAFPGAELIDDD
jgi:DNA polymerase III subunit gamma/tau